MKTEGNVFDNRENIFTRIVSGGAAVALLVVACLPQTSIPLKVLCGVLMLACAAIFAIGNF